MPDVRVTNKWGFESFPTEEAIRAYVRRFTTYRGAPWRIWRLPDGTFDFTSGSLPRRGMEELAELAGTQQPDPQPNKAANWDNWQAGD